MMPEHEAPPEGEAELRTIAMPADTNAYGDIFGGWLLAQMDLAAGSFAIQRARGRVATVGIEAMSFHRPVYVGDRVSCYCRTTRVGAEAATSRPCSR
jgi:acyl-CoA thioesterase YciA